MRSCSTHAQAVLGHARTLQLTSPTSARLLTGVGLYLWGRGLDLQLAQELHEQALAIYQRLYEGDHPDVAASLSSLAIGLRALGEHGRAQELNEQALAMRQRLTERRSSPGS